jgi:hypothetical protein
MKAGGEGFMRLPRSVAARIHKLITALNKKAGLPKHENRKWLYGLMKAARNAGVRRGAARR